MSSLYASTPVCLHCLQSWQGRTQTEPPLSLSSWTGSRRERARLHRYNVLLVPPLVSQLLLCCNALLSVLYPHWWMPLCLLTTLSLSLCLSPSLLCLYGLTLELNGVLFGWDGHTIIVLVRRWGFLSLRREERVSCFEKPMEGTIREAIEKEE